MLKYEDIEKLPKEQRFFQLMIKDPNIHNDVLEKSSMKELINWSFHRSLNNRLVHRILANLAKRIKNWETREQVRFLREHWYLSEYNILLGVQIIQRLMKSPTKNFKLVQEVEKCLTNKEAKILLWKSVFDGLARNRFEKRYALYRLFNLTPLGNNAVIRLKVEKGQNQWKNQALLIAA